MARLKEYTFIARVVGGGKVTIPLEVRRVLGIDDGESVEVTVKLLDTAEKESTSTQSR